jgi:hypothetical protein
VTRQQVLLDVGRAFARQLPLVESLGGRTTGAMPGVSGAGGGCCGH